MDRRTSLKKIVGKQSRDQQIWKKGIFTSRKVIETGLQKYNGTWSYLEASHLLRRCTFGPTDEQILDAIDNGMENTVAVLLEESPIPDPPVNYYFQDDPYVDIGESWVDAPYHPDIKLFAHRNRSFAAWLMKNIYNEGTSITEKMIAFWHNHFVTADVNDPKFDYDYFLSLRNKALGNFRDFVKEMTINPSMLRYLNGNQNTEKAPNENYARELLELFTIGKGPLAGPGDYTNYTEEDIAEVARVLTGWKDSGFRSIQDIPVSSFFRSSRHDKESKTFSHRLGQATINNEEENEYASLIDLILQQQECARFICRKLYRWFVYHLIDDHTEANIIEPLSQLMIANDYEIKPVLSSLLSSEHFYDFNNNGCLIKNPIDFVFSTLKTLKVEIPETDLKDNYNIFLLIGQFITQLQMEYGNPPSVAGWKAYYQQPSFYEIWINSVTLPYRMNFTSAITVTGIKKGSITAIADVLTLVNNLSNPSDINDLVNELVSMLFPQDITDKQKIYLKDILIPGLPDFEWSVEYFNYTSNQDDANVVKSMENKLRIFFNALLSMPEFYLS